MTSIFGMKRYSAGKVLSAESLKAAFTPVKTDIAELGRRKGMDMAGLLRPCEG